LKVVDHYDQRSALGQSGEQPVHRVLDSLRVDATDGFAEDGAEGVGHRAHVRQQFADLASHLSRLVRGQRTRGLADHLGKRQVRRAVAVVQAPTPQYHRLVPDAGQQLLKHPRLADPGRAEQRDQTGGPPDDGAVERLAQQPEFAVTADHRRVHQAGMTSGTGFDGDQSPRVHRQAPALEFQRWQRFGRDGVADQAVRVVAEQHLAGAGYLFQPRRDVRGIAERQILATEPATDNGFPGVHAGTQVQPDPEVALQQRVGLGHVGLQLRGGTHGPQRVVLPSHGYAEDRHNRVADELLHPPAVPAERRGGDLEVPGHHMPQRLRVEPLTEPGRPHDIGEYNRDGLAHLAGRTGGQLPPTPHAEPCPRRVVFAADRAGPRCPGRTRVHTASVWPASGRRQPPTVTAGIGFRLGTRPS
jgi:hypothetical protein